MAPIGKMFDNNKNRKHAISKRNEGPKNNGNRKSAHKGNPNSKNTNEKSSKFNYKLLGIIGGSVVGVILVGILALGGIAMSSDTVYPNVTLYGNKIGGMTYDEVYTVLENSGYDSEDKKVVVEVMGGETLIYTLEVTGEEANVSMSIDEAADFAVKYGHKGLFNSAFNYLGCLMGKRDISSAANSLDEEVIRAKVANAAEEVNSEYIENEYVILEEGIEVTKGAGNRKLDEDEVFTLISDAFAEGNYKPIIYNASTREPDAIDFQAISEEIFVEAENAKYDSETSSVVEAVTGKSIDIEAAQKAYDDAKVGTKFMIPFVLTEPEITAEQMEEMLFKDVLASKSTSLTSSSNRNNNIKLAAKAINGTVLNPGETFSFNGVVGQRTAAKGYKPAGAYVNGQTVNEIGGGICQVSSTIYYCVLVANLDVVNRSNHMFPVSYLPMGMDATVNWGTIDFKFANDTDYPIKITAYVEGYTLYVKILGTKTDDHTFKPTYKVVKTNPYKTVEKESTQVTKRTVQVTGVTGYVIDTYLSEYDGNGKLVRTTYVGRSTYRTRDQEVLIPVVVEGGEIEDGNTGDGNTGDGNTGDGNTGDGNTGDGNTGDGNTGDGNTGDGNTGDGNTGGGETGDGGTTPDTPAE